MGGGGGKGEGGVGNLGVIVVRVWCEPEFRNLPIHIPGF